MNLKKIAAGAVLLALAADAAFILIEVAKNVLEEESTPSARRMQEMENIKFRTA